MRWRVEVKGSAISPKEDSHRRQLARDVEESEVRLARFRAFAAPITSVPPREASEIEQLKAKLVQPITVVCERGGMIPPMPASRVPVKMDDWMFDRHGSLKDAMGF